MLFAIGLAVVGFISTASAQVHTNLNIGSLTAIAASTTTNAPSTACIQVKNHQEVMVTVEYALAGSDLASTSGTFKFSPSRYGTNDYNTAPNSQYAIVVVNNGTGVARGSTNIYVGSAQYFGMVSGQNGSTQAMSGLVVHIDEKDKRNGN